jgi:hypothetical protein
MQLGKAGDPLEVGLLQLAAAVASDRFGTRD